MSDRNPFGLPPTGSYPGFDIGLQMLDAWRDALHLQANIVNGVWSKLKGGTFEAQDGYKAIVDTVESSVTSVESMLARLTGTTNPPWVSLPPEAKGAVPVRLRSPISDADILRVSRLAMLGGPESQSLTATVTRTGAYSIDVLLSGKAETPGEYLGFVFSDRYAAPLAILAVSVAPKEPSATGRRTTEPRGIR